MTISRQAQPPGKDNSQALPAPAGQLAAGSRVSSPARLALIGLGLAAGLAAALWLSGMPLPWRSAAASPEPADDGKVADGAPPEKKGTEESEGDPPSETAGGHGHGQKPGSDKGKPTGSFLEAFGTPGAKPETGSGGTILGNAELEKHFRELSELQDQLDDIKIRGSKLPPTDRKAIADALARSQRLAKRLTQALGTFQKDLTAARAARPEDAVPQWLTGELLILVMGEPEEILVYLEQAEERGLQRPRLFSTLAHVELEANHFTRAHDLAVKGLDGAPKEQYAWESFRRAAFTLERQLQVLERIDRAFPAEKPEWASEMRRQAVDLQGRWEPEQHFRAAEKKADDLPRVKLVIEHRRFARDKDGKKLTTIEKSGTGEVMLELFEDQAPATVANFLNLVEKGFYDGTRFYLAQSATAVAGGDPKSKHADPAEDGTGDPGYVIPDEFNLPRARGHFRGSISMFNEGPHTTGSRFFITLAPQPGIDHRFTVFGRVIKGQGVVDEITTGRTNPQVGGFGKIIPGDLLVRATVIRKRPHEYKVIKEKP